jgi:ATP-dependent DNA helicase HFM1/MER3
MSLLRPTKACACLQARQLPGIGRLLAQRLKAAGAGTLRQLAVLDPRRIETITQRNYPFGRRQEASLR